MYKYGTLAIKSKTVLLPMWSMNAALSKSDFGVCYISNTIKYKQTYANYSSGHCPTVETQKQQSKINST